MAAVRQAAGGRDVGSAVAARWAVQWWQGGQHGGGEVGSTVVVRWQCSGGKAGSVVAAVRQAAQQQLRWAARRAVQWQ